jgi:hypothetical protein
MEAESAGHTRTTQPHRGQSLRSFRVVGRREYQNVIRNYCKGLIKMIPEITDEIFLTDGLYKAHDIENDDDVTTIINNIFFKTVKLDCHCIKCGKDSTFISPQNQGSRTYSLSWLENQKVFAREFYCSRNNEHKMYYMFLVTEDKLIKVGQFPSIADLTSPKIKKYQKVLNKSDYNELNKAIGLVSHGVGIGSFVYLRRIFEKLIMQSFEANKMNIDIQERDFIGSRMTDKIISLQKYLPKFLVENRGIYSILSKGIHELSEEECLDLYPIVIVGIELTLDEKIEASEKASKIETISKSISGILSKFGDGSNF